MSGYYPPGVSGNEYEIAGPDKTYYDEREVECQIDECVNFENPREAQVDIDTYDYKEFYKWVCPACGYENEFEKEIDTEEDPDRLHDGFFD